MKKFMAMAGLALCALSVRGQDIWVTNEGEALKIYNLEVSGSSVFYQLENREGAEIKKMAKSDMLVIKKKNGTKLDFSQPEPAAGTSVPEPPATAIPEGPSALSFPVYTTEQ